MQKEYIYSNQRETTELSIYMVITCKDCPIELMIKRLPYRSRSENSFRLDQIGPTVFRLRRAAVVASRSNIWQDPDPQTALFSAACDIIV